jgi:small GTP-binding protein
MTVRVWYEAGGARQVLVGHSDWVLSVVWSPDGRSLASGSRDDAVLVWDAVTGRMRITLEGHRTSAQSIAWSPDGAKLSTGSRDGTVRVWEALTGSVQILRGHRNQVQAVAWSLDGESIASGSYDGTVRVWDAGVGRLRHTLEGHSDWVKSLGWSPSGVSLVSGSFDNTVRTWDAATGLALATLEGHRGSVETAAWSPDGTELVSGSDDGVLRMCNAATGKLRYLFGGYCEFLGDVAWSLDGTSLACGSYDHMVRLWDSATGRLRQSLLGHTHWVQTVVWSPDGKSVATGSYDQTVRIWDAAAGFPRHLLKGHSDSVRSVMWSSDGLRLASGSADKTLRVWDTVSGRAIHVLEGHRHWVQAIAWSPDGAFLGSGSRDKTVRVWDLATGRLRLLLEGHRASVILLSWSLDGRFVASVDEDGAVCLWATEDGQLVDKRARLPFWQSPVGMTFGGSGTGWETDALTVVVWRPSISATVAPAQVLQASAKVILAGDRNVGKTCLARRLAEDRYESGQSSTHGMQIWTMAPEKLHVDGVARDGQSREVFLWDLGGQNEYQLVNQLFLNDSTVALVLFDAARGAVGMESAKVWNDRIETRANRAIRKLLIRSKADEAGVVSQMDIEEFRKRLGFRKFIPLSAKVDGDAGVANLRDELHRAIDWGSIAVTSRPISFQLTRDLLSKARQDGECVVYFDGLVKRLAKVGVSISPAELETTLAHLAREGQIVDLRLQSGDRVIVLRVDALSRYSGSLVQAARTNARGVPVLEQDRVLAKGMVFPGIADGERLDRAQEKTVLECAVRLMIERGTCFDHQGLLIFPTLFVEGAAREETLPPSAPVFYDFNGPIDNIYASLVARLAVSGKFGPVRLWSRYAEFGETSGGTFGLRRADSTGRGHLDLYFDASTNAELRLLFRDFVNDHLTSEGVSVLSGLAFACRVCGNELSEADIRYRLDEGKNQISCQRCETAYSLFTAAETTTVESRKALVAFKTDVEERTRSAEARVAAVMAKPRVVETNEPLRILHLSDLHFTGQTNIESALQPLAADLRDELRIGRLDYLVVSGDFADKCNSKGFDKALEFLKRVTERFGVSPLKTVLVPGNHDYSQGFDQFSISNWKAGTVYADGHQEGQVVFSPNEKYVERFNPFGKFYHSFYSTQKYPMEPEKQFETIRDEETGLWFLSLNSTWRVDQFRPERAELNNDALGAALLKTGRVKLGILVWHHAAAGDRKVADTDAMERLGDAGFRVLLHGDVHKHRDDLLNYLDARRRIHAIGGGAFGARMEDRPESTPRSYSLLEVARDLGRIRVVRRAQKTAEAAYGPRAVYPDSLHSMKAEYLIEVAHA